MVLNELTFLGESIVDVIERCINKPGYRCLVVVKHIEDCLSFAEGAEEELNLSRDNEFTMHVDRVARVDPMYTEILFKNKSVLRIMPYYKPPIGSFMWGQQYNYVLNISNVYDNDEVERWLQMIVVPYKYIPDGNREPNSNLANNCGGGVVADCADNLDTAELDEFLSGFEIIPRKEE